MSIPGRLLSQPAKVTSPSKRSACITVSTESAMTSRLTSDARIPSWPIEMPSDTAMVANSIGKPPASRTPTLERLASRSSGRLHGVTSFHDDATRHLRLAPVVVGHADGPQHRPGRRPVGAVGDVPAARLDVHGGLARLAAHGGRLPASARPTPAPTARS